eukprot:760772_1
MPQFKQATILLGIFLLQYARAFLSNPARASWPSTRRSSSEGNQEYSNILILDHLNINHQKLQHESLKAFYFSFLQCGIDPRKQENIEKGRKTLWANIGAHQFHLPEGQPDAQVLKGEITLGYDEASFQKMLDNYETNEDMISVLQDTKFNLEKVDSTSDKTFRVTDPWGTKFVIMTSDQISKDSRGLQNGEASLGSSTENLTFFTPSNANLAGIGRFYEKI